jgi:hypothetical protein
VLLSDIEPDFVFTACGKRGADVRPKFFASGCRLMPWSARFDEPITLPDGRTLKTLRDAANYITALPKAEHAPKNGRLPWKSCSWSPRRTVRR